MDILVLILLAACQKMGTQVFAHAATGVELPVEVTLDQELPGGAECSKTGFVARLGQMGGSGDDPVEI